MNFSQFQRFTWISFAHSSDDTLLSKSANQILNVLLPVSHFIISSSSSTRNSFQNRSNGAYYARFDSEGFNSKQDEDDQATQNSQCSQQVSDQESNSKSSELLYRLSQILRILFLNTFLLEVLYQLGTIQFQAVCCINIFHLDFFG